jgi:hypothetical protein
MGKPGSIRFQLDCWKRTDHHPLVKTSGQTEDSSGYRVQEVSRHYSRLQNAPDFSSMYRNIIYARLVLAGCIAGLLIMWCAGLGLAPALAHPVEPEVATAKATKPDSDLAAVHEFLEAISATLKTDSEISPSEGYGFERGVWRLPTTWCVARLGLPKDKPIEDCMVRELSGRRAAVVIVIKLCEHEHCEVDYWILSGRSGLRPSPIDLDFVPVVSPDSKYLFAGHTGMEPEVSGYIAYLTRVNLDTLETEHVANCAAPVLSPSERWVVCRDASGHVYRLPVQGEGFERIHTIDLGKDVIYSDAHMGVNLPPVQFINENRMRIVTLTHGETEDVEEAKWVDGPWSSRR